MIPHPNPNNRLHAYSNQPLTGGEISQVICQSHLLPLPDDILKQKADLWGQRAAAMTASPSINVGSMDDWQYRYTQQLRDSLFNILSEEFTYLNNGELKKLINSVFQPTTIDTILKYRSRFIKSLHFHLFPEEFDERRLRFPSQSAYALTVDIHSSEYQSAWKAKRRNFGLPEEKNWKLTYEFCEKRYAELSWHEIDTILKTRNA